MNTNHTATFQFAYDASSNEGYSSSQLSSRHYAGVNPREILKTMDLPALRIHKSTPKMPIRGHKAHRNHLQSYYDPARALQSVLRLKQTMLHLSIIEYIENAPYQPARGPLSPRDNGHPPSSTVKSLSDVSQWVYLYALLPMQQTLHHTAPSTKGYQWISADGNADERDLDRKLVRMYHWNTMDMVEVNGVEEHAAPAMIAFVQEPWVLSERDFTNFVRTKSMPQAPRQLTGKERLWAKIYDECTLANCRWFVVTTYYQWTFGCFSEGFQAAFITLDIPSPKPYIPFVTPLQTLYYWLASCMGLPEAFVPTQVMESPHLPGIVDRSQQYQQHVRNGEYRPSAAFQHSESEASSESDDDYKSTYSRHSHRPESEVSFQSSNKLSPTAQGFLRNVHIPGAHHHTHVLKVPIAGDQLTKEAILPRRHWPTNESAKQLEMARAQLQQNRSKYETLDWLDEGEWDRWEDGGSYDRPDESVNGITSTMRGVSLRERWVNTVDGVPPSPTLSAVSRDGSAVGGKRGGVGTAVFAVAPKHPRRTFAYQA